MGGGGLGLIPLTYAILDHPHPDQLGYWQVKKVCKTFMFLNRDPSHIIHTHTLLRPIIKRQREQMYLLSQADIHVHVKNVSKLIMYVYNQYKHIEKGFNLQMVNTRVCKVHHPWSQPSNPNVAIYDINTCRLVNNRLTLIEQILLKVKLITQPAKCVTYMNCDHHSWNSF